MGMLIVGSCYVKSTFVFVSCMRDLSVKFFVWGIISVTTFLWFPEKLLLVR